MGKNSEKKQPEKKEGDKQSASLHPLELEEALKALLEVDPEAVEERLKKEKQERKKKREKPN